jgi:hypothetical protein
MKIYKNGKVTAFELNEILKESCINFGANKAVTTRFEKGVGIIPEEFWETIIIIPKEKKDEVQNIYSMVEVYMNVFKYCGFDCAVPVLEYSLGEPRVIYAIFPGKKSFFAKLKYPNK